MRARTFRLSLIVLIAATRFVAADVTTQPSSTQPAVVKWEDAAKHVGETVTITGPVKGTHVTSDQKSLILNIGKDYPASDRFTIMMAINKENPVDAETYTDKTVTVTGKIELYRKVPEIKIAKAADVTIGKP